MALDKIVIKITGDTKEVTKTIDKLKEIGRVDRDNALIFAAASKKRQFLIDANIKRLAKLKLRRKEAFSPVEIRVFDDLIKRTSRDIETLGGKVKKLGKQTSILDTTFGKLGAVVLGAFAVNSILNFGKHLLELSVESEVFERRAKVVFGNSLEIVEEFAEESANSLGLTEIAFLGAAAAVGDILVPLGLSRKRAAEMSVEAVKLGGALKQFTGDSRSAAEISNIVARALTGEVEGLKTLGVVVDQTSIQFKDLVKSKQLELGLTKQQAKAESIFEIAIASSSDALKSFEDNTDSLVRQQAEFDAQSGELADTLAHLLAPAFLAVTTEANRAIGSLNEITKAEGSLFEKFFALVDITGQAEIRLKLMSLARKAVKESAEEELEIEEELVEIREDHVQTIGELKAEMAELRKAQDALIPGSKELLINQTRVKDIQKILKVEIEKSLSPFEKLTKRVSELKKELKDQAAEGDINKDTIKELNEAVRALARSEVELKIAMTSTLEPMKAQELQLQKIGGASQSAAGLEADFAQIQRDEIEATANKRFETINRVTELEQKAFAILQQININKLIALDNETIRALRALDIKALGEEEFAEKAKEIREKAAEERAKLLTKQAKADKIAAIFQATIDTANAIVSALTIPPPAGPILAGINAALGATQIAVIAAQPIPEFHEGKKAELKEGEMYAKILRSETIIPPDQSKKHTGLLDAVLEKNVDNYVFEEYMLPMMKNMAKDTTHIPFKDVPLWNNQKKQIRLMQEGNSLAKIMIKAMDNSNHRRTWR